MALAYFSSTLYKTDKSSLLTKKHSKRYKARGILVEGVHTIWEGVLIEEGTLTEVVQYFDYPN